MNLYDFSNQEIWFVTGSQHLCGLEALNQGSQNSQEVAGALDASESILVKLTFKKNRETPAEIRINEVYYDAFYGIAQGG